MYNKTVLTYLIKLIEKNDGIADKKKLAEIVKKELNLVKDRSVYYCDGEELDETINCVEDLINNTSAGWELIEEEGENKVEDLRELIKPCYVVVRKDESICGVFEIKEGLKLQEKLDMGTCWLNEYKNDLTKYNYPDSTDIVEVYGLSENVCFDISTKDRPLIWKREEETIKSPTQIEIESIELEQRKLADRLAKLKENL